MTANKKISPERARELALFRYHGALERGDFETVAAILKQAERDPILWQMIDDLAAFDEGAPEQHREPISRAPRNDKHITQSITVRDSASNGQTPKPDHSQEDSDMMLHTTFESTVPVNPKTLYPFAVRFITLAAAILIVAIVGGLLIEMVNKPLDGYPGVAQQIEAPKCAAESVTDTQAESIRLATAATMLLKTKDADRTPEMIEQAGLLALCALQTAYTPEADTALQQVMGMNGDTQSFTGNDMGGIFSPDGRYLLTGDNTMLRLWDVATGEKIREFDGHTDYIRAAAFSSDGRYIVSGAADNTARLWDAATGQEIRQFLNTGVVSIVAFSPDGKSVLSVVEGLTTAYLWDAATGQEIRQFKGHHSDIFGLGFSPDGRYVATSSNDSTVRLWDAATGDELRQFEPFKGFGGMVAFSSDGKYLLNSGAYAVRLSEVETGATIREYTRQGSRVLGYPSFSPDGRSILASDRDNKLALLWDAETGELVRTFDARVFDADARRMYNVSFSPDGRLVVMGTTHSGDSPHRIWLWDTDYHDTMARACAHITRDFTPEERAQYGLGEGAACPLKAG